MSVFASDAIDDVGVELLEPGDEEVLECRADDRCWPDCLGVVAEFGPVFGGADDGVGPEGFGAAGDGVGFGAVEGSVVLEDEGVEDLCALVLDFVEERARSGDGANRDDFFCPAANRSVRLLRCLGR